ncbi:MAG: hypothetical protein Q9195_000408 [Heterodermia aff. obscurata]
MTIRVVARIRPVHQTELEKDIIVKVGGNDRETPTLVKVPNPKNEHEDFTFQFSSVYTEAAEQQTIFDNEVVPTIKHLFSGFDVTIFAYGSTGTVRQRDMIDTSLGKTHTMRGGKTLAERGVIPRLLSGIYRRSRKLEKDSKGQTKVEITLSYYEIYNDKVFDLLEPPEKRTMAGLPLRDSNGKTVVVGLTERSCDNLKDFEKLYDQANVNRSTSATKLNAHSSRSHAILRIGLAVTTGDETRISTVSAIDLAGSEDNRRTENSKERLVESASINKSLFVLAKCVEAIGQKQRAPYRESKMTRILSLGQNNGMTVMILNLAPIRSHHLDTLSSLNFANRTKRIEVREVENEPIFRGCSRAVSAITGPSIQRQPLRPLATALHNATVNAVTTAKIGGKTGRTFSVYSDRARLSNTTARASYSENPRDSSPRKRPSDCLSASTARPCKRSSPGRIARPQPVISKESLDEMIEKKVGDILAARALDQPSIAPLHEISDELQKRLELLEQKIEGKEDGREQGLTFLLMAKQHAVRGEDMSALRMYTLAKDYFPDNAKLDTKIQRLRARLEDKRAQRGREGREGKSIDLGRSPIVIQDAVKKVGRGRMEDDENHVAETPPNDDDYDSAGSFKNNIKSKGKSRTRQAQPRCKVSDPLDAKVVALTPRTKRLLDIVNTRDLAQIRCLRGIGFKKAEAIRDALDRDEEDELQGCTVHSLAELGRLKGVGLKTVENMRVALGVTVGAL